MIISLGEIPRSGFIESKGVFFERLLTNVARLLHRKAVPVCPAKSCLREFASHLM